MHVAEPVRLVGVGGRGGEELVIMKSFCTVLTLISVSPSRCQWKAVIKIHVIPDVCLCLYLMSNSFLSDEWKTATLFIERH